MTDSSPSITVDLRVRYPECDPMGYAHHSVYPVWFEIARTELLRRTGVSYAELERDGLLIVVVRMELKYHRPARYDDEITIKAITTRAAGVRIEHDYEIRRGHEMLCTGKTTLACVDRDGRPQGVPEMLRIG